MRSVCRWKSSPPLCNSTRFVCLKGKQLLTLQDWKVKLCANQFLDSISVQYKIPLFPSIPLSLIQSQLFDPAELDFNRHALLTWSFTIQLGTIHEPSFESSKSVSWSKLIWFAIRTQREEWHAVEESLLPSRDSRPTKFDKNGTQNKHVSRW